MDGRQHIANMNMSSRSLKTEECFCSRESGLNMAHYVLHFKYKTFLHHLLSVSQFAKSEFSALVKDT